MFERVSKVIDRVMDVAIPGRRLSPEERAAVTAERISQNRTRVTVMASVMLVFHVVYAIYYSVLSGEVAETHVEWRTNLQIIHITGCVANLVVLLALRRHRLVGELWMLMYLAYGAVVSANTQLLASTIDVFVIVTIGLPFVIRVRPIPWVVGSSAAVALLLAGAAYLQPDAGARFAIINNAIPTVLVTWVVVRLQATAFARDVVQRRTIERQRDELSSLNARLDRQLRQLVIDRSRDLGKAIGRVAPAPSELAAGTVLLDRFEIVREIGKGGMGIVYRAHDRLVGRPVALKVIRFGGERSSVQRFLREVEAMSEIDHPAVARSLHVDLTHSGRLFQAQELVTGEPLDAVKRRAGVLELEHAAAIGEVLAASAAAAHARGVIHRDVKPSNVMLTADEPGLKLLDFGVSKLMASDEEHTQSGVMIGTPAFMAPEQRSATDATPASDIYSLGMTLFAVLTDGKQEPRSPARKPILDTIARCLEPEPASRPSASDLEVELARLRGDRSLAERNLAVLPPADRTHDTVELR
jgi:hypothetical protein